MGRVMVQVKVTNYGDKAAAGNGLISPDQIRSVTIEALVDTGSTMLVLTEDVVDALGLAREGTRRMRLADGRVQDVPWVGGVRIEILSREMTCDALVVPRGLRSLVGQIPLEGLDLVVDPKSGEVRVNPESPDVPLMDAMAA